jgi:hypothetical protein
MDPRFSIITTASGVSVFDFSPACSTPASSAPVPAAPSKPAKPAAGGKAKAAGGAGGTVVSSTSDKPKSSEDSKAEVAVAEPEGPKSFARRDRLRGIEIDMQALWEAEKVFEDNAPAVDDGRGKFFVTFPYPYMNGKLHLGHGPSPRAFLVLPSSRKPLCHEHLFAF